MTLPDLPNPTPTPPTPTPPLPAEPPKQAEGGISQEELSRIATREKEQGRQAALAQVATDLGVSLEDAKRIIAEAKTREDSEKSEAQKAREAADVEKAKAQAETTAAAAERHGMAIERALMSKGILDTVKIGRLARLLDSKPGDAADAIKAAVESLEKDMPELFVTTAPVPPKLRAPGGDPKGNPPPPKQNEDAFARGAELALSRGNMGNPYPTK